MVQEGVALTVTRSALFFEQKRRFFNLSSVTNSMCLYSLLGESKLQRREFA